MRRSQQPQDALDQIADVADGPGLAAVAGHGNRLTAQRLADERGDGPAVVRPHPRAVGVEDAHDLCIDLVTLAVGHGQRLGEAFRLVVDTARADRVHVAPVVLALWVDQRIAVYLGGRGEQEARALLPGQAQRVDGPDRADLQRLYGQLEVVDRARGGGEVEHRVHLAAYVEILGHVVAHQPERGVLDQVRHVSRGTGAEVIQAYYRAALGQQPFGKVRAEESRAPSDADRVQARHASLSFCNGANLPGNA